MSSDDADDAAGPPVTEPPRDIRIERETRAFYDALQEESGSPYEGARLYEIFLTATAVGSYEGLRQPLEGETVGLFNASSLSREHATIIRSIAWKETRDEEIYFDQKRAYEIAMEFANGGIRRLHDRRLGLGDTVSETVSDYVRRWKEVEELREEDSVLTDE